MLNKFFTLPVTNPHTGEVHEQGYGKMRGINADIETGSVTIPYKVWASQAAMEAGYPPIVQRTFTLGRGTPATDPVWEHKTVDGRKIMDEEGKPVMIKVAEGKPATKGFMELLAEREDMQQVFDSIVSIALPLMIAYEGELSEAVIQDATPA